MYIRCKRTNQTVFLYVDPTDSISAVKKKLSAIINTPAENILLLASDSTSKPLEDENKTVAENKIENDSILYWIQKKDGGKIIIVL